MFIRVLKGPMLLTFMKTQHQSTKDEPYDLGHVTLASPTSIGKPSGLETTEVRMTQRLWWCWKTYYGMYLIYAVISCYIHLVKRQLEFVEVYIWLYYISYLPNGASHRSGYRIGLGMASCFTSRMGDDEHEGSHQKRGEYLPTKSMKRDHQGNFKPWLDRGLRVFEFYVIG